MKAAQAVSLLARIPRWVKEGLVIVAVMLAIALYQSRGLPSGPAPAFALRSLEGREVTSASLAGKPTLLVFWAPWCGVCKAMGSNVSWLQSWTRGRAQVLSVASEYQDEGEVRAYVEEHGVDYPVLLGGRKTARAFGVKAYPTLFFLDEQGTIRRAAVGYTTTLGMYLRLP